jgi:hypothetical protein
MRTAAASSGGAPATAPDAPPCEPGGALVAAVAAVAAVARLGVGAAAAARGWSLLSPGIGISEPRSPAR